MLEAEMVVQVLKAFISVTSYIYASEHTQLDVFDVALYILLYFRLWNLSSTLHMLTMVGVWVILAIEKHCF